MNGSILTRSGCPSNPTFNPAWKTSKIAGILTICLLSFFSARSQDCKDCDISSFQSFTTYYIAQPGSLIGFGVEGGNWNKEDSRFSYFLGTKMQWFQVDPKSQKTANGDGAVRLSFYIKGQARIINRLYLEVAPQLVNLTAFETSVGLRYTYPLSSVIGVGLEPSYSIIQKEYALNVNIHFAL